MNDATAGRPDESAARSAAPPRRIVLLAQSLRVAGGLSVGKNVLASLARIAPQHEYLMLVPPGCGYETGERPPLGRMEVVQRPLGLASLLWFEWARLPRLVREFRPDIVWGLGNYALAAPGCFQAILFHQAYLLYDPRSQARRVWRIGAPLRYVEFALRRALPATQLVFCQTETALNRFRRKYAPQARLALLPNAVSRFAVAHEAAPPPLPASSAAKFKLLCLTRYYPHKNLEILAELFEQHREALRDVAVVLTIAADQMPPAEALLARIKRGGLEENLVNVGPVQQAQLPGLYRSCDALILPTVLESFSGTYLEAMQFGTPILTSEMDFAREICGDAAHYFDPFDTARIRDAILALRGDGVARAALIERGRARVQQLFRTWDEIMCEAMDVVMDAYARRTATAAAS